MSTDQFEPAAPGDDRHDDGTFYRHYFGLTAREHAAIALRVPDSGNDWLDAMIRTAQRNEYAGQVLNAHAMYFENGYSMGNSEHRQFLARDCFAMADAMLAGAQIAEGG